MGAVTEVRDQKFEKLVTSQDLVLLFFTASWCSPCQIFSRYLVQLAREYANQAFVVTIDIDKNKATTRKFRILSLPALLILKQGQLAEKIEGVASYEKLRTTIQKYL
jgi:thioredoxin 1